jgi:hypothetical protein
VGQDTCLYIKEGPFKKYCAPSRFQVALTLLMGMDLQLAA